MALTRPKASQINFDLTNISDPIIRLNSNKTDANDTDVGFIFERGSTGDNAVLIWDESADQFVLGTTTATGVTQGDLTVTASALGIGSLTLGGTAVTATAAELNILDGVTATTAELNYVDGVTSAIQTQIDGKASLSGATFTGAVSGTDLTLTGDLSLNDADDQIIHGDTNYNQKQYVLYGSTSDATETEIFVGGTTNSRIPVASNTTVFYEVNIVARRTDATGESGGWHLKAVVDNFSGTVADVGSVYEVQVASDDANYAVDARADNTNDSIGIYVTGVAGKTISWTAIVKTFEVAQ